MAERTLLYSAVVVMCGHVTLAVIPGIGAVALVLAAGLALAVVPIRRLMSGVH